MPCSTSVSPDTWLDPPAQGWTPGQPHRLFSQQIKQLSRELDVTLLSRHGRQVRLTAAARTLLTHADILFAQWERARAELDAHVEEVSGTLALAGFSTAAGVLLPATMTSLTERFPQLRTQAIEAEPAECYDLVLSGTADLAVVVVTPTTPSRTPAGRLSTNASCLSDGDR